MSIVETVPSPHWVMAHQKPEAVDKAKLRFLIRLAALYHNERASLGLLSIAIGKSEPSLAMVCKRGEISAETAIAIENAIGRSLFPREMFRPDLFVLPQE